MAGDPAPGARLKIDMHLHTAASFDCTSDPDLVVRVALARGIDRVCITDHDELDAALWLRRRYGEVVIPGEEVKTAERVDVIGLYLRERIPRGTPAREACEWIRDQGGLVYIPHPFGGLRGTGAPVLDAIADLVHVVEGFNGRIHDQRQNRRAVEWAAERGLPTGAGSDAHTLREVGRTHARVPAFEDGPGGLLEALRASELSGHQSSYLVHVASTFARLRKRVWPRPRSFGGGDGGDADGRSGP